MKKIILILVALAMSMQFSAYAAELDSENGNDNYETRLEFLKALDIIEDTDVESDGVISRAKFISAILNFANINVHPNDATGTKFKDVDKDYAYAAQIERGADLGYMVGYSGGNFYPESPVTYNQAVKVIVSVLGYDMQAGQRGGYPTGYISVASSIGLTKGVKQVDDELTMSSFAVLLTNACECPVVLYDIENKTYETGKGKNDTALYYFHKIAKVKGVVSANDVTGIKDVNDAQPEGHVVVDGEMMSAGLTSAKNMLGYSVIAYVYYEDETETGEIKYITADSKNRVVTVESKHILYDDGAFSGTNFVYENESLSKRSIKIKSETAIIFNGVAKPLYSVSDLAISLGDVTFIDNNGDGTYDCASIFSVTKAIVPEFIAEDNEKVTLIDYFNPSNKYEYEKGYKYYDVTIDGEKIDYLNIKKDMIVLIGENNTGEGKHSITRAYSKDTKIGGVVKSIGEDWIDISGTTYDYSPFMDKSGIRSNSIGYFWVYKDVVYGYQKSNIEIDGETVYADEYEYGYLISGYCQYEPEQFVRLKILTSYNEFEKYESTSKTIYNGMRIKDPYKAAELFAKSWSGEEVEFKPQLIKYKLDENNKLKAVYTADYPEELKYEGNVNTEFKDADNKTVIRVEKNGVVSLIDKSNIAQYGFYVDTWLNFFYQDDNTVVFHINDGDLEQSYASGKFPSASTPNEGKFVHDFYNVDEDTNTVAAVVWHSNLSQDRQQVSREAQPMVVSDIFTIRNSDGDFVTQIDGIVNGGVMGIQYNEKMTDINKQIFNSIGIGDIIFYDVDAKGVISAIEKAFDARRIGEYGMSNNAQFDTVHDTWSPPVHLYRKVGYYEIEKKLHNNFYSYRNGEGALCIQQVDPAARFYLMTINGNNVSVKEITYSEVFGGDEVFTMLEFNKLKCMFVINVEE